ncbi:M16 family metallopeptidase [Treponema sp.]|uniref:M16 family metallopeptidase n=1 Tax=Treponema sp. TaxID=166 RepID=UPI00258115CD|nr:M16 family metallopeptidase [Treponema sp.]MBE6353702.1 insulinase family protein [Treponema sp.]
MKTKRFFMAAFFCLVSVFIYARSTPVKGLSEYTLDNGLQVFVAENHTVPLVYIEIAVRSGAVDQTPETAGLFHLYEHMMFKGNALYNDAAAVKKAMSDLGVTQWNGTTGINRVNYFFTVPSDRLEEGMAFWNAAIRFPLMDRTEFENEKKVVLAEIEGDQAESSHKLFNYFISTFFEDAPYRLDAGGSFEAVRNATVEQLLEIKNRYYIPSNAALFIGGDVNPEEVHVLAEKIFGTWNNNGVKNEKRVQQNVNPFPVMKKAVMSYDSLSSQFVNYQLSFRGPDTDYEIEDTYAADYILTLLEKPSGSYVQSLINDKNMQIPGPEYVSASYQTTRANGTFDFSAMSYTPEGNIAENALYFSKTVTEKVLPELYGDKSLFSKTQVKEIAENIADSRLLSEETAEGLLSNLSFWWSIVPVDYYYQYSKKLQKVSWQDAQHFIKKYFYERNPMLLVLVNPEVYEAHKADFEKAGFETIDGEKNVWWKSGKYSAQADVSFHSLQTVSEEVYVPVKKESLQKKTEASAVTVKNLSNGIPVYFVKGSGSSCVSVNLGLKGGVARLERSTSGLEKALCELLSMSSQNYSAYERSLLAYKTKGSLSCSSYMTGSVLSMNCLSKYFDTVFDVYADSILNPDFNETELKKLYAGYENTVHQESVEPVQQLYKKINDYMFAGHPYDVRSYVTDFSLEGITLDNMKNLYAQVFVPENMFFLVSGDVKEKTVLKKLDSSFGKIKGTGKKTAENGEIPPLTIKSGESIVVKNENARGTAYIGRVFVSPPNTSEDYPAALIASAVYNDQLFNSVRIARSVCYTPSTMVVGSKAPYGMEFLFKVSDFKGFKKALDEAREYLKKGLVITGTDEKGSYVTEPLENMLESYKNKYINSTFHQKQTPSAASQELAYNILQFDDAGHSLKLLDMVRSLTAEQVQSVFIRYWGAEADKWFAVCDPSEAEIIKSVLNSK